MQEKKEIKAKFENFDLVENFAATNFSTKPGYYCTLLSFQEMMRAETLYVLCSQSQVLSSRHIFPGFVRRQHQRFGHKSTGKIGHFT